MMLSEAEMAEIDNWRFSNHVATRSEAIRRLCQMALILDSKLTPIAEAVNAFGTENAQLMEAYRDLLDNKADHEDAAKRAAVYAASSLAKYQNMLFTIREVTGRAYDFKRQGSYEEAAAEAEANRQFFDEILREMSELDTKYKEVKSRLANKQGGSDEGSDAQGNDDG